MWLICALLLSACTPFGARLPAASGVGSFADNFDPLRFEGDMERRRNERERIVRRALAEEYAAFRDLHDTSLYMREQLSTYGELIRKKVEDKKVRSVDRELILAGAVWFLELDALLYMQWLEYRRYLPAATEPDPYAPFYGASLLNNDTRLKGGILALASEVVRMDNATIAIDVLDDEVALTRFLNIGDESRGIPTETFDRVIGSITDPDRRLQIQVQLLALKEKQNKARQLAQVDADVAFALGTIDRSGFAQSVLKEGAFTRQFRFLSTAISQSSQTLLSPVIDFTVREAIKESAKFKARSRFIKAESLDALYDSLEPLDIILLKDAGREGNLLGFTHALVFLGDAQSLRAETPKHIAWRKHGRILREGGLFLDATALGIVPQKLASLSVVELAVVARVKHKPSRTKGLDALMKRFTPSGYEPDLSAQLVGDVFSTQIENFTGLLRMIENAKNKGELELNFWGDAEGHIVDGAAGRYSAIMKELGILPKDN